MANYLQSPDGTWWQEKIGNDGVTYWEEYTGPVTPGPGPVPAGDPHTISGRVAEVLLALGNRTDLTYRVITWLKEAYISLGMSYPFEELEETYTPICGANEDGFTLPEDCRAVKALTLQWPNGQMRELDYKDIRYIRRYNSSAPGPAAVYTPYKDRILFRPKLDTNYNFILDYWKKPEIAGNVEETYLAVPDDWLEVIDVEAIIRGHMKLFERDKAQELRVYLRGDPAHPEVPGLIKALMIRRQADMPARDYGIRPRVRAYSGGSRI